jgi:hypothetical protein
VVDVDLHGGHVYGNTWFTLFSPRIQNYTIGVEPGTGWGPEERDPKKYDPFVSWMGRLDDNYGPGRSSGGLFRRAYNYTPDGKDYASQPPSAGLVGVPIQVWSTKTFSASWERPIKEDELIEANLKFAAANPDQVSGEIKSHLPVELRDVVLFYRNKYYPLERLTPGEAQRIDGFGVGLPAKGTPAGNWFGQQFTPQQVVQPGRRTGFNQDMAQPVGSYMKSILFHNYPGDAVVAQGVRNSSLRFLDERWRLDDNNRGEVILVGRAVPAPGSGADGKADEVSQSGQSASKLWLGGLPGSSKSRDAINGTMSQDTYVRVYIPVK